MLTWLRYLTAASVLLLSSAAQADFVSTDWKNQGDGLATLDTTTGLEWLRLTETKNLSIQTILDQMDTTYAGWRFATFDEVRSIHTSIWGLTPSDNSSGNWNWGSFSPTLTLAEQIFGRTYYYSDDQYGTAGLVYDTDLNSVRYQSTGRAPYYGNPSVYFSQLRHSSSYTTSYSSNTIGVFLVSDGGTTLSSINDPSLNINNPNAPVNAAPTEVNAPSAFSLSALMLCGFAAYRRKKH